MLAFFHFRYLGTFPYYLIVVSFLYALPELLYRVLERGHVDTLTKSLSDRVSQYFP